MKFSIFKMILNSSQRILFDTVVHLIFITFLYQFVSQLFSGLKFYAESKWKRMVTQQLRCEWQNCEGVLSQFIKIFWFMTEC